MPHMHMAEEPIGLFLMTAIFDLHHTQVSKPERPLTLLMESFQNISSFQLLKETELCHH